MFGDNCRDKMLRWSKLCSIVQLKLHCIFGIGSCIVISTVRDSILVFYAEILSIIRLQVQKQLIFRLSVDINNQTSCIHLIKPFFECLCLESFFHKPWLDKSQ